MAFTFATVAAPVGTNGTGTPQNDAIYGLFTTTATTDASSAAGTFSCPFKPRLITVIDQTNVTRYEFVDGMTAAYMFKTVTAGTFTLVTTNGITIAATANATAGAGPFDVTLGTGLHVNSSTYRIICYR